MREITCHEQADTLSIFHFIFDYSFQYDRIHGDITNEYTDFQLDHIENLCVADHSRSMVPRL